MCYPVHKLGSNAAFGLNKLMCIEGLALLCQFFTSVKHSAILTDIKKSHLRPHLFGHMFQGMFDNLPPGQFAPD